MEESEGLAYDDPPLQLRCYCHGADSPPVPPLSSRDESGNSPATTLRGSAPCSLGSPLEQMPPLVPAVTTQASGVDTVEVHAPSQSWTTCKVEAHVRASPENVKTVVRVAGRWRLKMSVIYS